MAGPVTAIKDVENDTGIGLRQNRDADTPGEESKRLVAGCACKKMRYQHVIPGPY